MFFDSLTLDEKLLKFHQDFDVEEARSNDSVSIFIVFKPLQNFNHKVMSITLYVKIEEKNEINICCIQRLAIN